MKYIKVSISLPQENCYLLYDEKTKKTAIIDPGNDPERIISTIKNNELKPENILLTHAHADHIAGIAKLKAEFENLKIHIHEADEEMLKNSKLNLSDYIFAKKLEFTPDILLKDDDEIKISDEKIKVIHTPGHSMGGVCYFIENFLFCGDTIFKLGIGRTDFYGGDFSALLNSIRNKIFAMDKNTILLPGHGDESTIEYEINYNPYLR